MSFLFLVRTYYGGTANSRKAMFEQKENPGYEHLSQNAKGLIVGWLQNDWYETSAEPRPMLEESSDRIDL